MTSAATSTSTSAADEFKQKGNDFLAQGHFNEAIAAYTKAIEVNPKEAVYFANRAQANIKAENYGAAITDAEEAIKLNSQYAKAHHRLGVAKLGLARYQDALPHFRRVCVLEPQDAAARAKLQEVQQLVKKIAFEEAIRFEEESPFNNFDYEAMDEAKNLIEAFKQGKKLHKKYFWRIVFNAKALLDKAPTRVDVPLCDKITVCGDVHGQYYDFVHIFELNGLPSESNPYLFNGDFVDRGMAYKWLLPNHLWLNRGNHETAGMNRMYGFDDEIRQKYDERAVNCSRELFNALPLAHVVQEKVLVVHGGLFAKDGVTLADIGNVDRRRQPPDSGIMADLLWSDPAPPGVMGRSPSKRGNGICFGADVTTRFLDENKLKMLVRSHEVKDNGYEMDVGGRLCTVFSAPNYMDQVGNKGAYLVFDRNADATPHSFVAVPHPAVKPMAYSRQFSMFGM